MDVYVHHGYANAIRTVEEFYRANKDMLDPALRRQVFPVERPVRTKIHEYPLHRLRLCRGDPEDLRGSLHREHV